jgi:hypothetical protein
METTEKINEENEKKREKKIFNNSILILTRCSFLNPTETEQQQTFFYLKPEFLCIRRIYFYFFFLSKSHSGRIYRWKIYIFMFEF